MYYAIVVCIFKVATNRYYRDSFDLHLSRANSVLQDPTVQMTPEPWRRHVNIGCDVCYKYKYTTGKASHSLQVEVEPRFERRYIMPQHSDRLRGQQALPYTYRQ